MKIAVLGAHGQIAMLLHPILRSNGHEVIGLIRNPEHAEEVQRAGARTGNLRRGERRMTFRKLSAAWMP
jgi:putative NADH-flavin reductase